MSSYPRKTFLRIPPSLVTTALVVLSACGLGSCGGGGGPASVAELPPIDPQVVRDQDDMTWEDYQPIPGTDWANPERVGTDKQIRIAIVTADFPDQPFVMTLPKESDMFGNPQVDPVAREDVPEFYADFWNKPQEVNRGHTIHEYWMELSRGRVGISVVPFGPYRMPLNVFQYGLPQSAMPDTFTASRRIVNDLDSLWQADQGANVGDSFDIKLRIYAGYDETTTWQEFGEMKFQTPEDIPPEWGNPDSTKPRWVNTRYIDWTSWKAGEWLWSNSAIVQGESSGSIRHEITHFAFRIGDNNNNPYVEPYRRAGSGPWDVMDRGSFNGPGGPHKRFLVPVLQGGAMPASLMLRQMMNFGFLSDDQVLTLSREGLASSGLVVARVTAREAEPEPGTLAGIVVRLDGAEPHDRTPPDDPAVNPLSPGTPNYDFYTLEAVQRIGYDSYSPDAGVLLAKNKDQATSNGGPNGFRVFNWVIDAHPEDIGMVDFYRPDGTPVMRTIADYRQLNDALFHAGLDSGSEFEWEDTPNGLHFYVIDLQPGDDGVRTYTLGVRSLSGSGPQSRGVALAAPAAQEGATATNGVTEIQFTLTNTGSAATVPGEVHPSDASVYLGSDVYRLEASVEGEGWSVRLLNALAAAPFGRSTEVPVYVSHGPGAAASVTVTLTATSESDPSKVATATYTTSR